jgi:integrase
MTSEPRRPKTRRVGQVIKRGENKYLVRIPLGTDPVTRKRRTHNHTVRGTKKDAQTYLTATLRDIDLGTFVEPSRHSLDTYLDYWLKAVAKPRVGERTGSDYESIIKRYITGTKLGKMRLSHIRAKDIQTRYGDLLEKDLSSRTVRYVHAVLSSALDHAVKTNMLSRNPADLVELPKMEQKEMQAMSPEESERFIAALDGSPHRVVLLFALATGARPEEFMALKWRDLDLRRATVSIQRVLIRRQKGGGWYFNEPKTKKSRRTINLSASLVAELIEHRRVQNEARLQVGPHWQNHDLVFCTEEGTPLSIHNLTGRHFKPTLVRAGLPDIRLYDLRHTHATLLLLAGENPKVVSERLGHSSIQLTLDTYSRAADHAGFGCGEVGKNAL